MKTDNQAKKILLYTRPISPPWDEASKNLAWSLAKNCQGDFEFHVLATHSLEILRKELSDKNVVLETIYPSVTFNGWAKFKLLMRLYRLKLGADIVHFLFTPRSLTSLLIQLRLFFSKSKSVQTVATISETEYQKPSRLKKSFFADKVIVQSRHTQEKLKKIGKKTELIYPGIDLEKFQPAAKNDSLMQQFGIKPDDLVLLFGGEYTKIGGVDNVISALEILHQNQTKTSFKLILALRIKCKADKEKKILLQNRIKNTPIENKIIFLDAFVEMPKLYCLSDIDLFTVSEMTGKFDIPFVMIEAMACAKPLVISDLPVLQEFVKDDYNGLVAKNNAPENIAACIEKLSTNTELRNKLGQNALAYAQENFDIQKTAKKYEEIYMKL